MIISVDFDGTIVENGRWPEIGALIPGAANALRILRSRGHKIIINSCRCGAIIQHRLWVKTGFRKTVLSGGKND